MFEELKEMICEYVDVEPGEIREDSRFVEDLGFNSYDFMSMVEYRVERRCERRSGRAGSGQCKDSKGRHGVYPVPAVGCLRRERGRRRNGSKYITGDHKPGG